MVKISKLFTNLGSFLATPFERKPHNPLSDFSLHYSGSTFTHSVHASSRRHGVSSIKVEHNGRCHLNCKLLKSDDPKNAQAKKLVFDLLKYNGYEIPEKFEFLNKYSNGSSFLIDTDTKPRENHLIHI